jgi:hypothetical protein
VDYPPPPHEDGVLSAIVRAFVESKPTLLLALELPF